MAPWLRRLGEPRDTMALERFEILIEEGQGRRQYIPVDLNDDLDRPIESIHLVVERYLAGPVFTDDKLLGDYRCGEG